MFQFASGKEKATAKKGVLTTKLSPYERHKIDRMFRTHKGLFILIASKMKQQYPSVCYDDIMSCMNMAFVKAARSYDPAKGKFSTILTQFARGECSHYLRSSDYWGYSVNNNIRELGIKARRLISFRNAPIFALPKILGCSKEQLREALEATLHVAYGDSGRYAQEEKEEEHSMV